MVLTRRTPDERLSVWCLASVSRSRCRQRGHHVIIINWPHRTFHGHSFDCPTLQTEVRLAAGPQHQILRNDPSRERYYSDWNWISPSLVVVVDVCLWLSICAPLSLTSLTWHNGNPDWADPSTPTSGPGRGQYKHAATRVELGSTGVTPSNQRVKYTCHNQHQ